jgi:hypothetical protein
MPEKYRPLEVLTAKQVEDLVLAYAPAMEPTKLKNIVSVVMGIAKIHGVMVVKADEREYALHLKYLTTINWTP